MFKIFWATDWDRLTIIQDAPVTNLLFLVRKARSAAETDDVPLFLIDQITIGQ